MLKENDPGFTGWWGIPLDRNPGGGTGVIVGVDGTAFIEGARD